MSMIQSDLLLGQEGGAGYTISRSLRFNSSDSAFCGRSFSSAGNQKTWSWSAWVKKCNVSTQQSIWSAGSTGTNRSNVLFQGGGEIRFFNYAGSVNVDLVTTPVFRDPSAWYHILVAVDTTQATSTNRFKLYVNGTQITTFSTATYPSQNQDLVINSAITHGIGRGEQSGGEYFDGYLADVIFIDGQQLTPSALVETSATTGQLIPKAYTGSFGTNGFWLKFSDNSAATATTLGKDYSGNNNNWTPNNLSVTAGAGNDSLTDTPSSYGTDTGAGGEVRGNYCTLNPLAGKLTVTLSDGNLTRSGSVANNRMGTIGMSSGKWYWEVLIQDVGAGTFIGVTTYESEPDNYAENYVYNSSGGKYIGTTLSSYGASYGVNDIIGVAYDADTGTLTCYKNNVSQGQLVTGIAKRAFPLSRTDGTGQHTFNFGQRPFAYTAPSGFKALCDTNLPAPVVAKSSDYFQTVLYTGNGSTQTISGLGFSPDLVWIKGRSFAEYHGLFNTVSGTGKVLFSNATDAENSYTASTQNLTAFNSDGFSLGTDGPVGTNRSSTTYAAWCWDAGSSTVTNTQGSITSQVRANPSAGFSIVTYTGNATAGATVGHGLNTRLGLYIIKNRDTADPWIVFGSAIDSTGANGVLILNSTAARSTSATTTATTSTTFPLSQYADVNGNGQRIVAYCFAPVAGYSSMGSYVGNGAQPEGPMITTMFKPRWVLIKSTSSADDWVIFDTARNAYNVTNTWLRPNDASAEITDTVGTVDVIDIVSNGFKVRGGDTRVNGTGYTYIYFAVAESPFQYARAR